MAEPYHSNIRHFLESGMWQCLLCQGRVSPDFALEHQKVCPVELRIREVIRDEFTRLTQQRSGG